MPPAQTRRRRGIGDTIGEHYATNHGRERGAVRDVLTKGLVEFVGDPSAEMHWAPTRFQKYVFLRYRIKLSGWPDEVKFTNMSKLGDHPTAKIRMLLQHWEDGEMYWEAATDGEVLAARESVYNTLPGKLFPANVERPHAQRCDVGARRECPKTNPERVWGTRHTRGGARSLQAVAGEWLEGEASDVEEIEDTRGCDLEAWRTRRLQSGELADDRIECD